MSQYNTGTVSVVNGDPNVYFVYEATVTPTTGTITIGEPLDFLSTGASGTVRSWTPGTLTLKYTVESTDQPVVGETVLRLPTFSGTIQSVDVDAQFIDNADPGHTFLPLHDGLPAAIYEIGSIPTRSHLVLNGNFQGTTSSGADYLISTSFTPTHSIPYAEPGDQEPTAIFKRGMIKIDSLLTTISGIADGSGVTTLNGESGDLTLSGSNGVTIHVPVADAGLIVVSGTANEYIILEDRKSPQTDGGTPSTNWYDRDLTHIAFDDTEEVIVDHLGRFRLPRGEYQYEAIVPFYRTERARARLYNVTDDYPVRLGTSTFMDNSATGGDVIYSHIKGKLTVHYNTLFKIQGIVENAQSDTGDGVETASVLSTEFEAYTTIVLNRTNLFPEPITDTNGEVTVWREHNSLAGADNDIGDDSIDGYLLIPIDQIVFDETGEALVGDDQIRQNPGLYQVHARLPGYQVEEFGSILWDDTNGGVLMQGTIGKASTNVQTWSHIIGVLELSTVLEMEGRTSYVSTAGGISGNGAGFDDEVYQVINFRKGQDGLYLWIQETAASGTAGGTFTSGAWQTRAINSVVRDDIGGISISSSQFTLPAGLYEIDGVAVAHRVNQHMARIYDVDNAVPILYGMNAYAGFTSEAQTCSYIRGRFGLGEATTIEIQHRCASTRATDGFGSPLDHIYDEIYGSYVFHQLRAG